MNEITLKEGFLHNHEWHIDRHLRATFASVFYKTGPFSDEAIIVDFNKAKVLHEKIKEVAKQFFVYERYDLYQEHLDLIKEHNACCNLIKFEDGEKPPSIDFD